MPVEALMAPKTAPRFFACVSRSARFLMVGTIARAVVLSRINPSGVTFLKKREVYGFLARLTFSLLVFQMSRRLLQLLGLVV
jgi:hypothetical protein